MPRLSLAKQKSGNCSIILSTPFLFISVAAVWSEFYAEAVSKYIQVGQAQERWGQGYELMYEMLPVKIFHHRQWIKNK